MPGRKTSDEGANFVTGLELHRTVAAVDPADVDGIDEFIDSRKDPQGRANKHGRDSAIFLCILLKTIIAADIELWVTTNPEVFDKGGSSSPSSPSAEVNPWCKVDAASIAGNERLAFEGLVPGVYKVRVAGITGAGEIFIYEQHTE